MILLRKADERGHTRLTWLDSRHTFSFGDYYDPKYTGFRHLRVINEDRVRAGAGFGSHSHRDMEIVTYVLEGALEHKDSLGTGSVIRPGEVQRMSAGTGISHSEFNCSQTEPVHFLQIWIVPEAMGIEPGYEQRSFDLGKSPGRWTLIASRGGRDGAVEIHQDVDLWSARLALGQTIHYSLRPGRHAWIQVARGRLTLNGISLNQGDGASASQEEALHVQADRSSELLLFDLH